MPDSSDNEQPVKGRAIKKPKKAPKGALRGEVQDMVERIHMGGDDGRESKRVKTTVLDNHTPKKYQHSGLRKDLKSHKAPETFDPLASGGLDDEDAFSVRPTFACTKVPHLRVRSQPLPAAKDLNRDHSRRNDLVLIQEERNDQPAPPTKAKNTVTKPAKPTQRHQSKAAPIMNAVPTRSNFGNSLDRFLKDRRWAKVFIPSLTHALYVSREPFKYFATDSPVFLTTVQTIFDKVFSDADVVLSTGDPINAKAFDRIKSRRSKLGSAIVDFIKKHFESPGFTSEPTNIREYVRWALHPGGPAYYAKPTPKDCKVALDHPDFVTPDGFLESQFIAPFAEQHINFAKNSILDPPISKKNPPEGLYAMILISVERGFTAHINGGFTAPPHFNHDNCWWPLQDFLKNIEKIKESRWKAILQFHCVDEDETVDNDDDKEANQSMISAYRAGMYIPSSPLKP
ncbi:hypothetical protein K443DRAFT_14424 [Laccaria amethystina LaAM-08-1]|uniref:Uncharacterized protein n=1 Tax=Laccaria amethystina LaAM-08-1 TaxID=1095629 RepID=A0A0C9WMU4_9AGAR|nr:hypothetical protein K443DRAFT_14424 [Laccaria amethystina LaAM-08-1]